MRKGSYSNYIDLRSVLAIDRSQGCTMNWYSYHTATYYKWPNLCFDRNPNMSPVHPQGGRRPNFGQPVPCPPPAELIVIVQYAQIYSPSPPSDYRKTRVHRHAGAPLVTSRVSGLPTPVVGVFKWEWRQRCTTSANMNVNHQGVRAGKCIRNGRLYRIHSRSGSASLLSVNKI